MTIVTCPRMRPNSAGRIQRQLRLVIGAGATIAAAGCNRGGITSTAAPTPGADPWLLRLARETGAQVRREGRFFVVYPRFISRDGLTDVAMLPDDYVFLESLRAGANAHFADTSAYADPRRLAALPDSARFFFTMVGPPRVEADSGFAEIVEGRAGTAGEPLQREVLRYVFVRRGATWEFVRHVRLYST